MGVGAQHARSDDGEPRERGPARMSETVLPAGGDQHQTRCNAGEEGEGAAAVGAMVWGDEGVASRILAGRQEGRFSIRFEVPGEDDRGAVSGPCAQREAAVVDRAVPVADSWMEDAEIEARARDGVAAP